MNASTSPQGFSTVRGRGYRPEQVDRRIAGLSGARDDAWERAARLTVLEKELAAEAEVLRERVAQLAPQTYETLTDRARSLLALAREESEELRAWTVDEAAAVVGAAEAAARARRDEARKAADRLRSEAAEAAAAVLAAARAEADGLRAGAQGDAEQWRADALAALKETRRRTEELRTAQEKEHAERWEATGRELAEREKEAADRFTELTERAEVVLGKAKRALAETQEEARHRQEDAEARGAEVIAEARVAEERIIRETQRVVREHEEQRDELHAHMTHVRNSLSTLTGRPTPEPADDTHLTQ